MSTVAAVVIAAQRHLEEAGPLVDEAGQLRVAADYRTIEVEGREVQLKKRLYAVRSRYDSYPPELQALFLGLGLPWVKGPASGVGWTTLLGRTVRICKAVAPDATVRNEYGCDVAAQAV
ncbi:hypothetical protein [Streptomyces sp. S186]|uniref:hypothetical protein n=1 Tax=Streptomyces sp. S186 TaxID=3434395 RepID=UPI003F672438